MMNAVERRFLKAIRGRVCHNCDDLLPTKGCRRRGRGCPVDMHLRDVVRIAGAARGQTADAYALELRNTACAACGVGVRMEDCPPRRRANCAIDRYLMCVFEAIADVHEQLMVERRHSVH